MDNKNMFYLLLSRYITYLGTLVISVVLIGGNLYSIIIFSLLFIVVLINSIIRIEKLENKPYAIMLSVLFEIPLLMVMQLKFDSIVFVLLYVTAVDIYLELKLKHALFMSVFIYSALFVASIRIGEDGSVTSILFNFAVLVFIMTFFCGASFITRREMDTRIEMQSLYEENRKSREELEKANKKLFEYAKKVEDIAVLNERNRLAGEIHDTIGHSLTALIMEIDICSKLLDKDHIKTREELQKASVLARNTLAQVRNSVSAIKPSNIEDMMGIHAIEDLIREFEKATGIIVKLKVSKNRYKLSPAIDVTIYRTIQEALTNCAKHGQADRVLIDLGFQEGQIHLNIRDNGQGCSDFSKGVGIKTMEERIHALGGNVSFGMDDGFVIESIIPVEVA